MVAAIFDYKLVAMLSSRERKSVARFAPDNNYQGQFVDPTTPNGKVRKPDGNRLWPFLRIQCSGIKYVLSRWDRGGAVVQSVRCKHS